MKVVSKIFLVLAATLFVNGASAQSLTEKLVAEDPAELVQQSRTNGEIVRGAILFHQGNINCAKCHRPSAEIDRFGPDLSRMGPEVTDELIVESILQPSKAIKKGFETVTATTIDGKLVSGIVVSGDEQKLVIRDRQNVDELHTILREDIDQFRHDSLSSMPDKLADQFKDRQQFLDLVRYVIDIRDRGPEAEVITTNLPVRPELSPELNGLILIQEMNCVACHASDSELSMVSPKTAPQLKWSGNWLNPVFIERFIAYPHAERPGTTMPDMFAHLDDDIRKQTARAITHFLLSKVSNEFRTEAIDVDAVPRGFELFHEVGCIACHAPRDEQALELKMKESAPLGNLVPKYSVSRLVEFLKNPHIVRPSGRMPNMQLTHREAVDISNYLLQSTPGTTIQWQPVADLIAKGEQLFLQHNCNKCHTDILPDESEPPSILPLADLRPMAGCLSDNRGEWPDFHFQDFQLQQIRAALEIQPGLLTETQQIEITLKTFNCIACHDRDGLGGVAPERNPHFQTTNLNLGDQGRIPPTLTGVGAKLNSKWMRDVLVNHRTIRPYMKTRMPQFGEENVGHLVELFEANDRLAETRFAEFTDQEETRKKGLELAGNKGLNCVACHTYKFELSDTMPAVDLTEMAERLKKDWFYQYMLAPQKFSPNTVMPSFWPGGLAIRKDIEGTPEDQIEALWQYLIDGRQAGTPSGVVREPLEIVVTSEAKMLRRSYPGIGKRGIGVGYPGGVNLAFDAEQLRLATIWKGKFVDPAGVWTGQGSGNVRPVGTTIDFAKGPDLDYKNNSWIVDDGRPPNHQFKGYYLDESRRPTFQYRFDSIGVEDFFSEVIDESTKQIHLRRSVLMSTAERRNPLRFRLVSATGINPNADGSFSIDNQMKIRVVSDHEAQVVDDGTGGKQLEIPLELAPDVVQKLVVEYLWE